MFKLDKCHEYLFANVLLTFTLGLTPLPSALAATPAEIRSNDSHPTYKWFVIVLLIWNFCTKIMETRVFQYARTRFIEIVLDRADEFFKKRRKKDAIYEAYQAAVAIGSVSRAESFTRFRNMVRPTNVFERISRWFAVTQPFLCNPLASFEDFAIRLLFILNCALHFNVPYYWTCALVVVDARGLVNWIHVTLHELSHSIRSVGGTLPVSKVALTGAVKDMSIAAYNSMIEAPIAGIEVLTHDSDLRDAISFAVLCWTGPKKDDKRFFPHYTTIFVDLLASLKKRHGRYWSTCVRVLRQELKMEVAETKDGEEDVTVSDSWISSLMEGLRALQNSDSGPAIKAVDGLVTLCCGLPVLLSDMLNSENFSDVWKLIKKSMKSVGWGLENVIQSMVTMKGLVFGVTSVGGGVRLLMDILTGDELNKEFVECSNLINGIENGTKRMGGNDLSKLNERIKRLSNKCSVAAARGKKEDVSRWKDCSGLLSRIARQVCVTNSKPTPFVLSFHGPAGNGKTTVGKQYMKLMHKWVGLDDIMQFSQVNIDEKWDNLTTNSTTGIIIDDAGNVLPEFREKTLSGLLLKVVQNEPTPIPKADLESKGNQFYQPYFVFIADNTVKRGIDQEIMDPYAGYRRLGTIVRVTIKDEYVDKLGNLDPTKINSPFGDHLQFEVSVPSAKLNSVGVGFPSVPVVTTSDGRTAAQLDNKEFLTLLKRMVLEHFEKESNRLITAAAATDLPLCPECGVLPCKFCSCQGMGQEATDPPEGGCETSEALPACLAPLVPRMNAHVFERSTSSLLYRIELYVRSEYWLAVVCYTYPILEILLLILSAACTLSPLPDVYAGCAAGACFALVAIIMYLKYKMHSLRWVATRTLLEHSVAMDGIAATALASISALLACRTVLKYFTREGPIAQQGSLTFGENLKNLEETEVIEEHVVEKHDIPEKQFYELFKKVPEELPLSGEKPNNVAELDIQRMVRDHTFKATVVTENATFDMRVFFVNSYRILMVAHALVSEVSENKVSMRYPARLDIKKGDEIVSVSVNSHNCVKLRGQDAVLISIMKPVVGLVKNLIPYLPMTTGSGLQTAYRVMEHQSDYINIQLQAQSTTYAIPNVPGRMKSNFQYRIQNQKGEESKVGYCGYMYVRKSAPRTILGIHTSGDGIDSTAAAVTTDLLAEAEKTLVERGAVVVVEEIPKVYANAKRTRILEFRPLPEDHPAAEYPESSVFQKEGVLNTPAHRFTSNIKVSPGYKSAVAHLGVNPQRVKPKQRWKQSARKLLTTASVDMPSPHEDLVHTAMKLVERDMTQEMDARLISMLPTCHDWTRPLNLHEVLNGVRGTSINKLALDRASGIGGKKFDFVEEIQVGPNVEVHLTDEARKDVQACVDALYKGASLGTQFYTVLKDEPVAIKDGAPKPSRIFYVGNFHFLIASACFIKPLLAVIQLDRVFFYTAIGMNPTSGDWHEAMSQFADPRFRNNIICGDVKSYDMRQNPVFKAAGRHRFIAIAEKLGWNSWDITALRTIIAILQNSGIDMFGVYVYFATLMLSGVIDTTDTNGYMTAVKMVTWILWRTYEEGADPYFLTNWRTEFRLMTSGDDFVKAVSDEARAAGYTPSSLCKFYKLYGEKITDANKNELTDFISFDEIVFIKRKNYYNSDLGMNVGVLSPESLFKPYTYHEPQNSFHEYIISIIESTMHEAKFGGRDYYTDIQNRIRLYCAAEGIPVHDCVTMSYDQAIADMKLAVPQENLSEGGTTPLEDMYKYQQLPRLVDDDGRWIAEADVEITAEKEGSDLVQFSTGVEEEVRASDIAPYQESVEHGTAVTGFLGRKYYLMNIKWDVNGLSVGQDGKSWMNPWQILFNNALFQEKMSHIAGFRCKGLELTFDVNSSASQAGCVMASVFYHPMILSDGRANQWDALVRASQRPNVEIILSAMDNQFVLTVPFHCRYPFCHPGSDALSVLPQVTFSELSNLVSTIGTPQPVFIAVYARIIDLETSGATQANVAGAFAEARLSGKTMDKTQIDLDSSTSLDDDLKESWDFMEAQLTVVDSCSTNNYSWPSPTPPDEDFREPFAVAPNVKRWRLERLRVALWRAMPHLSSLPDISSTVVEKFMFDELQGERPGYCYLSAFSREVWPFVSAYCGPNPLASSIFDLIHAGFVYNLVPHRISRGHWDVVRGWNELQIDDSFWRALAKEEPHSPKLHVRQEPGSAWVTSYRRAVGLNLLRLEKVLEVYSLKTGEDLKKKLRIGGEDANEREKVSTIMNNVAVATRSVANLPGAGFLAFPAEIISKAGQAAATFGFSKTIESRDGNIGPFSANTRGFDKASVLSLTAQQEVGVLAEDDNMDYTRLANKWTLIDALAMSTGMPVGFRMATYNVTPLIGIEGSGENQIQLASCALAPSFFTYWNGTMEYKIKVSLPKMAVCKLKVVYDPLVTSHSELGQSRALTEEMNQTRVFDVVRDEEITLRVKSHRYKGGLLTFPRDEADTTAADYGAWKGYYSGNPRAHNGAIGIIVHQPLNGPAGSSLSVNVRVYARCTNLMLWGYRGALPNGWSSVADGVTALGNGAMTQLTDSVDSVLCASQAPNVCDPAVPDPLPQAAPPKAQDNFAVDCNDHVDYGDGWLATACVWRDGETLPPTPGPTVPATPGPTNGPGTAAPVTSAPTTAAPTGPQTSAPTTQAPTAGSTLSIETWTTTPLTAFVEYDYNDTNNGVYFESTDGVEVLIAPSPGTDQNFGVYGINPGGSSSTSEYNYRNTNGTVSVGGSPRNSPTYETVSDPVNVSPTDRLFVANNTATGDGVMRIRNVTVSVPTGFEFRSRLINSGVAMNPTSGDWDNGIPYGYHYATAGGHVGSPREGSWVRRFDKGGANVSGFTPADPADLIPLFWSTNLYGNGPGYTLGNFGFTHTPVVFLVYGKFAVYGDLTKTVVYHESAVDAWRAVVVEIPVSHFDTGTEDSRSSSNVFVQFDTDATYTHSMGKFMWYLVPGGTQTFSALPASSYEYPVRRRLRDWMAEADPRDIDPVSSDSIVFELGGDEIPNDHYVRCYAGERITSFRELLKIPAPVRIMKVEDGQTSAVATEMYINGDSSSGLFSVLQNTYAYVRGGVMAHFVLLGEGSIEVTRKTGKLTLSDHTFPGVAFANNYTNPYLTVKVPFQSWNLYEYAGQARGPPVQKIVIMYGNRNFTVKEYQSIAEDFSMMAYNGAPLLRFSG